MGRIGGTIETVAADGAITLKDGNILSLWGLQIADLERANELLRGKSIGCAIVDEIDGMFVSDCWLFPTNESHPSASHKLALYVWMVELAALSYGCGTNTVFDEVNTHAEGFSYYCYEGGQPERRYSGPIR